MSNVPPNTPTPGRPPSLNVHPSPELVAALKAGGPLPEPLRAELVTKARQALPPDITAGQTWRTPHGRARVLAVRDNVAHVEQLDRNTAPGLGTVPARPLDPQAVTIELTALYGHITSGRWTLEANA